MSDDWYWEPNPWGFGSTYAITNEEEPYDAVEALRLVVEEVTGVEVERPEPRKIGFY